MRFRDLLIFDVAPRPPPACEDYIALYTAITLRKSPPKTPRFRPTSTLIACALLSAVGGCVEQTMEITSDPPGALVYLNDHEVGRTPLKRDFVWYGNYQVEVRKEGYETLKTHKWLYAPAYNWAPVDLISQLQPLTLHDNQTMHFVLATKDPVADNPVELIARAQSLRGELESSDFTRKPMPTTMPATMPTTTIPVAR